MERGWYITTTFLVRRVAMVLACVQLLFWGVAWYTA
jgi:hypothetical protein